MKPAIIIVVVTALLLLVLFRTPSAAPRAAQVTTCTNTEPATLDAFLANSTVRGLNWSWPSTNLSINASRPEPSETAAGVRGFFVLNEILNNKGIDYNYSYVSLDGFQMSAINISNASCAVVAADLVHYAENQSRSPDKPATLPNITYETQTLNGVTAYTDPVIGGYHWCNRADNAFFAAEYRGFANYTETYVTACTTRQTTSEEDACRSTTQPATWNGTSCRCVTTSFALDVLNATATCGQDVKAANETCGGPRADTCLTGYRCKPLNATSEDTTGTCTKRTALDDLTDHFKNTPVAVLAIAAALVAAAYLLGRHKKK